MKKRTARITIAVILFAFIFSVFSYAAEPAASGTEVKDADYLQSVMDMIKEKYKGQITDEQLIEGALKGMFNTMDNYTTYFTPEESSSFLGQVNGTYYGIGVMLEKQGDYVVVIKVFPSTPAEMAGILPGDKFYKVGDKSAVGMAADQLSGYVKGAAGTKVKLELLRNGKTIKKEVPRQQIAISPVTYEIKGDIGYIRLDSFSADAGQYMAEALAAMDKAKITRIVLDLRNNGGGFVDQAVSIAQNFVPKGLVTKLDFKSERYTDVEYNSYLEKPKYKLAVLVNGLSASASEILAGAIQDTKAGVLIGTQTFGKGVFQTLEPILKPEAYEKYSNQLGVKIVDGADLAQYGIVPSKSEVMGYSKITLGAYYTPNGRMIDKEGLTPDVVVKDPVITKNIDVGSIQKLKKTGKLKLNDEGIDVYNAEKILLLAGYNVNTPDVKLDSKTVSAIKVFQKANKKTATGVLDTATQELLNKKLDQLFKTIDLQYSKAVELLNKK